MSTDRPVRAWTGLADRGDPGSQALLSAALLVPAFLLFYLRAWPFIVGSADQWDDAGVALWSLGGTMLIDVYFIAVVAVLTPEPRRRSLSVALAAAAIPIDVLCWFLLSFVVVAGYSLVDISLTVLSVGVSVAAWGVARRRHRAWALGLVPSVPITAASAWVAEQQWAHSCGWVFLSVVLYGSFALCCIICWLIDVAARTVTGASMRDANGDAKVADATDATDATDTAVTDAI